MGQCHVMAAISLDQGLVSGMQASAGATLDAWERTGWVMVSPMEPKSVLICDLTRARWHVTEPDAGVAPAANSAPG